MCSSTPSPDPLIGQAAKDNAAIAREALQYYKDRDAAQAPRQAQMDALTTKLADQQLATSKFNDQQGRELWTRYQNVGVPAEDAMYADAANYDNQANRDKAADDAGNDMAAVAARAADAQRRTLARSGVNPADGRALALGGETAATGALAEAAARNGARTRVRDMGVMLRKDAAGFARGMPSTAAQTFGTAAAAGGQASGAVGAAIGAANATTQTTGAGFNTAINGNNSAGSILNQEYGNNINAANSSGMGSTLSGIGSIGMGLGAMGMKFSDEAMKEGKAPVDADQALAGMRKLSVKSWRYKSDSPADDGGQPHIGAMAQDMQQELGDTVAPGGKMVDPVSAIGATMAAVQALDKKVSRLAAKGVKR